MRRSWASRQAGPVGNDAQRIISVGGVPVTQVVGNVRTPALASAAPGRSARRELLGPEPVEWSDRPAKAPPARIVERAAALDGHPRRSICLGSSGDG